MNSNKINHWNYHRNYSHTSGFAWSNIVDLTLTSKDNAVRGQPYTFIYLHYLENYHLLIQNCDLSQHISKKTNQLSCIVSIALLVTLMNYGRCDWDYSAPCAIVTFPLRMAHWVTNVSCHVRALSFHHWWKYIVIHWSVVH